MAYISKGRKAPMSAKEDVSLARRLETIEKRMGRLEQLINVVLEKQEQRSVKIERRIELAFDAVGNRIEGLRERLEDVFFAEIQQYLEKGYTDRK
jgi:hypothetical protein